jgi:hypothetical protein
MGISLYRRWQSIFGFLFGLFLSWILFGGNNRDEVEWISSRKDVEGGIQLAENWKRIILGRKHDENGQNVLAQQPKVFLFDFNF